MRDFDRSLHNNWDRELESSLPDSRLSGPRRRATTVIRGGVKYETCFCANCGKPGGLITADWAPHVFYVCNDEACMKFAEQVPDSKFATAEEEKTIRG